MSVRIYIQQQVCICHDIDQSDIFFVHLFNSKILAPQIGKWRFVWKKIPQTNQVNRLPIFFSFSCEFEYEASPKIHWCSTKRESPIELPASSSKHHTIIKQPLNDYLGMYFDRRFAARCGLWSNNETMEWPHLESVAFRKYIYFKNVGSYLKLA